MQKFIFTVHNVFCGALTSEGWREACQPSLQGKQEPLVAVWRCSPFIKWTEWTLAMTMWSWWQHYKHCHGYYYYYYYYRRCWNAQVSSGWAYPWSAILSPFSVGWVQEGHPTCESWLLVCWWWQLDCRFARLTVLSPALLQLNLLTPVNLESGC